METVDISDSDFGVTVRASPKELTAVMRGRLTAASVNASAGPILDPIERFKPRDVIIEGSAITYCDGAGLGLIGEIRRAASLAHSAVRVKGFSIDLQALIDTAALPDPSAPCG